MKLICIKMVAKLFMSQLHLKLELMHIETCKTSRLENAAKTLKQLHKSWRQQGNTNAFSNRVSLSLVRLIGYPSEFRRYFLLLAFVLFLGGIRFESTLTHPCWASSMSFVPRLVVWSCQIIAHFLRKAKQKEQR